MRTLALLTLITAIAAPTAPDSLKIPDEPSYENDGINHADDLDPGPSVLDGFALKIAEKDRPRLALKMSDSDDWIA